MVMRTLSNFLSLPWEREETTRGGSVLSEPILAYNQPTKAAVSCF
jgi:hypothetical protein